MLELLRRRYSQRSGNGPAWAFIPKVRSAAGWGDIYNGGGFARTCDALALALWESKGFELHGHEIKCSRSDWLRELKDPSKAEAVAAYCDRWWLVASSADVVRRGELPDGWGLLVQSGARLTARVRAAKRDALPLPRGLVVAMTRAAIRGGALGGEDRAA